MQSIVLIAASVLLLAAIGLQLAIPRIAARRVVTRLTTGGGHAEVRIAAFPAVRLLRNEGDELRVRGSGLEIGLAGGRSDAGDPVGISALDGFTAVDIELTAFRTGPFAIDAFVLARSGGESYAMATSGTISGTDLIRLGEGALRGGPAGSLLGVVARRAGQLASSLLPFSVEIELISEEGGLRVGAGGGSIAGYPAGPVATVIAAAVARRLEIVP